ncbi:MAG: CHAP domain-containing protein [[Clostridium] spiroforme]|uniref:N-acetylmuramoyl-L-alanine amidase n=1 Tax=Thomasclavelia spiroformis TaxID=29348 RepID=A0A943ELI2_9FIRM|nr:CHAP domain-containing protein [Thomasclavelia spiroformis]MBS5588709.1 CHAP domain-containing protein [Thomasclavelia spiroformis]
MSNVDKILNVARACIGCKESNGSHKQIIDVYNAYTPLARNYKVKYNDSWCMTFISACFIKAGLAALCPLECSCGNAITKAKEMSIWQENDDITPNVGDLIMYDWDKKDGWPEHVGIVESVTNNQITVIEGNKSNAVGRRVINVGNANIRGYIQPNYDGSISNNQPSKPISNEKIVNYKVKVNTKSGVNCRKKPSVSSAKITAYTNETILHVTKEQNGWLYVNDTGWVSEQYCVKVTGSSSSSSNESWKGDTRYYLNNSAVGEWQAAMNKGFDTNELEVDDKFGAGSQAFAKTHLLWSGQTHNCPTAIKWLQERLRYYGFTKLEVNGEWSDYLTTCVKTFQNNRGLEADGKVGLITTYWLLEGTFK